MLGWAPGSGWGGGCLLRASSVSWGKTSRVSGGSGAPGRKILIFAAEEADPLLVGPPCIPGDTGLRLNPWETVCSSKADGEALAC